MERTAVNPWDWSIKLGYNQAEVIQGATRQVICAGQTAVDAQGNPQHPDDMRAQITLALDNLEAVLKGAGMDLSNVIKLGVYATLKRRQQPKIIGVAWKAGDAVQLAVHQKQPCPGLPLPCPSLRG